MALPNSRVGTNPRMLPCGSNNVDEFLSSPSEEVVDTMRRHPGAVAVLGAGGKMGLHLCMMLRRALDRLGRKDPVYAVSRFESLRARDEFARAGIEIRVCDLEVETELAMLPMVPTVFFLAGVKFGTTDTPDLLERTNVRMPRLVAKHFRNAGIVAFSTGCVYPFVAPSTGGATEAVPPVPNGAYAASCLARELAFADAGRQHGTRSILIRLNYAVEFRYGLLVDVALKVLRGEPVDLTTGHVNVIWQTDALHQAVRALDHISAGAAPLNVTGPDTLRVRDIAGRFGGLLGRTVNFVGTEADSAWLNNATKAHALFGRPQVTLDEMQWWIAAWLQAGGETWNKPTGFERRDGKF
jgi:nucleoside-diphosphate-sugar epimerase